jgi:manganese-dependent ADP-ribose/CDP-alcohol diphosphatase
MPIQIRITSFLSNDAFLVKILSVLKRQIAERCGCQVEISDSADLALIFAIRNDLGEDSFSIEDSKHVEKAEKTQGNEIRITGQNLRGVLYGLGRFLHTSQYALEKFIPSSWRGTSIPDTLLRAMYFATHFFNFYHSAPLEKIQCYVEDLALWGINALFVWYDMHHFNGITDPRALVFLSRLQSILQSAKDLDLQTGIGLIANEGYANSPKELRADQTFPGTRHIRGGYGVEICPSTSSGVALIMQSFREEFESFANANLKPDFLMVWPYDQGGCCCEGCRPWGSNGFLKMAPRIAELARQFFPLSKIILSTWLFDPNGIDEGEWKGLSEQLADHPTWVDYILADSHTTFPEYPLIHGSPGNFPLVNFPEISMWNMIPWGGFGANPLPMRFQELWNNIKDHISGGIPYSEGIFEDLNKVIWAQFYWRKQLPVEDIMREYCQYEFPGCDVDLLIHAIKILERNHCDFKIKKLPKGSKSETDDSAQIAFRIFTEINTALPSHIKHAWRWRILYLRALIDAERFHTNQYPNLMVKHAFEELKQIYYAQRAEYSVRPPTIRFSWVKRILMHGTNQHANQIANQIANQHANQKSDQMLFSFGIFADAQYADKKQHGARHYRQSLNKLKKCVHTLNSTHLDFIVNLGDLIDEGEHNLDTMLEVCDGFSVPVYHLLGNHDYNISEALKPKIHELFSMPAKFSSFSLNGWRIILLDGNELSFYAYPKQSEQYHQSETYYQTNNITKPDWDGGIGKQELTWLEDQLIQTQHSQERVIIFCHSPAYPDTHYALWNAPEVFSVIDRYPSVKAYFAGHNHNGSYARTQQTHYVTFKGMVDSRRNAFAIVKVYSNRIQIHGFGREHSHILDL